MRPRRCAIAAAASRRRRRASAAPSEADNMNARPSEGLDKTGSPGVGGRTTMSLDTCLRAAARACSHSPASEDAVVIVVEALEQTLLILLPFVQQLRHGDFRVIDADASDTAIRAEGADGLVRLQPILGVPVAAAEQQHIGQLAENSRSVAVWRTSGHSVLPYHTSLLHREHLRAAWVDHALPGAVVQHKGRVAGAARRRWSSLAIGRSSGVPRSCSATRCTVCRSTGL